jgi:starch synthase
MKVLLASSEVHPYSKTGGLADMTGALAKSLARAGADVVMVTPLYQGIKERFPDLRHIPYSIDVPMGSRHMHADVYRHSPLPHLQVLFVDQPAYFHRNELYQEHGVDYADNAARFLFFSKCVVHLARHLPLHPQVLHLHDWQVGLVPLLIRHQTWKDGWGNPPATVFTLHNLAYQGHFPPTEYQLTNLPWDYWQPGVEFYGSMNCLKAGIHHADTITTVSPRYAREILTEAFGFGLDGVLRHREDDLTGILNGVDYDEWKTEGNPYLRHSFNAKNLRGKALEKASLQKELGLPIQPHTPLFGNISRLVDQKGSDLILGAMEEMLSNDLQYIQLGSGMPELEEGFLQLAKRYPDKVATHIGYDAALAHRIEAGSDFFLMPSRYEPCGLNQLYSMRYGTIPVVRSTGGLDDAVTDVTEDPKKANGIEFRDATASSLANAIRKALALYAAPRALRSFRQRAMAMDFSWEGTAQQYLRIYRRVSGLEG